MLELNYHLLDVFTDAPFGGNQLAVFPQANGLTTEQMQALARELNLSETAFVLPPPNHDADFTLRIFTPQMELPMAGHPTVGTGYVLHRLGMALAPGQIRFEEGIGTVPVELSMNALGTLVVTMQQPISEFGAVFENRTDFAALLSLETSELLDDCPIQVVSSGVPFVYIPVVSLDAMAKIQLRLDLWEQLLKHTDHPHLFVFTPETVNTDATVHSRMFAPAMGILEDPATGAASGPLGMYLLHHGLVAAENATTIVSEQGFEMGRPSFVHVCVERDGDTVTRILVGGTSVYMGHGTIILR